MIGLQDDYFVVSLLNDWIRRMTITQYPILLTAAFPSTIEIGKLVAKLFRLSVREWFLTSVKVIIESRQKAPVSNCLILLYH